MKMLFKELKVEDICETNVMPVQPKEDTAVGFPTLSVSSPKKSASSIFSQNILQWTQKQVQDWLLEHNLVQMSRLLTNYDGRSLIYLSKYMNNCQSQQILNLLREDSLRRINESVSLIELSYLHSLMDQQKSNTEKKISQLSSLINNTIQETRL